MYLYQINIYGSATLSDVLCETVDDDLLTSIENGNHQFIGLNNVIQSVTNRSYIFDVFIVLNPKRPENIL